MRPKPCLAVFTLTLQVRSVYFPEIHETPTLAMRHHFTFSDVGSDVEN
jgi:hypothetical protein